ncbi:hypothetical protein DFJ74DRAFT_760305 [Hyaloraphidium curvatum]|nr:hypothetical protein DFJ74DRAFT_760305 [Hyaloraphidium curvatum]
MFVSDGNLTRRGWITNECARHIVILRTECRGSSDQVPSDTCSPSSIRSSRAANPGIVEIQSTCSHETDADAILDTKPGPISRSGDKDAPILNSSSKWACLHLTCEEHRVLLFGRSKDRSTSPLAHPGSVDRMALTAAELLAVLPAVSAPAPPWPGEPAPPDDAAESACALRAATRPTNASLAAAAARASPLLGFCARVALAALGPRSRPLYPLPAIVSTVAALASMAALPAVVDVPFSAAQIAVGTAALAASLGLVTLGVAALTFRGWAAVTDPSNHMLHAVSRWIDLCRLETDGCGPRHPPSLVVHVTGDDDCTCPAQTCAGSLPGRAAAYFLAESGIRVALLVLICPLFSCWTPIVTYGAVWFSTWWSALVGALAIAGSATAWVATCGALFRNPNPPVVELSRRLQRRAMGRALTALLDRYRGLLVACGTVTDADADAAKGGAAEGPTFSAEGDGDPGKSTSDLLDSEPYARLYLHLAADWSQHRQTRAWRIISSIITLSLAGCIAGGIANIVVGSCIPAWQIAYIAWWIVYHMVYITSLAAANARIASVRGLLLQARIRAEALLVAAAESDALHSPSPQRMAIRAALACHADRIRTFSTAGDPAKFLGFEASFGTARAFLVTSLTVGFTVYGLLRGLGVRVVLESYCGA